MASTESKNSDLEDTISDLESRIADLEGAIMILDSNVANLQSTVADLESQIWDLEGRIVALEQRVSDLENGPSVFLGNPNPVGPQEWNIDVAGVSELTPLWSWKAVLVRNHGQNSVMDPLSQGTSGNIEFFDLDGGGTLSVGDYFRIDTLSRSQYALSIIWKDSGNAIDMRQWFT